MHSYVLYDDIGRKQFGDKPTVGSQSVACLSCHDAAQAFLATNLSFDHPFGVPYRGFQKLTGNNKPPKPDDKTNGDADSRLPKSSAKQLKWVDDFRTPARGTVDNRTVWWVQSSGEGLQRTSNDLPLYARPEAGAGEEIPQEIPYIECTSCHNPHSSNPLFLRVNNAGSRLCLTCHDK